MRRPWTGEHGPLALPAPHPAELGPHLLGEDLGDLGVEHGAEVQVGQGAAVAQEQLLGPRVQVGQAARGHVVLAYEVVRGLHQVEQPSGAVAVGHELGHVRHDADHPGGAALRVVAGGEVVVDPADRAVGCAQPMEQLRGRGLVHGAVHGRPRARRSSG